jgi:hypothetical protein
MKKLFYFFSALLVLHSTSFGQNSNDKILYVVDSIPVIDDPEEGNDISQNDIADMTVIRNKDTLKQLGYESLDGIIYLFTKEYRNRPDSLKQIPSSM